MTDAYAKAHRTDADVIAASLYPHPLHGLDGLRYDA